MLEKARERVARKGISNMRLLEMDAADLKFADDTFDIVYAPYLISVVPDPGRRRARDAPRLPARRPHHLPQPFPQPNPLLASIERAISPFTVHIGFKSDLDLPAFLAQADLEAGVDRKGERPADLVARHLYQGLSVSRPWLALVLALFCLPLFIGLGREDVRDDEAIYSFAVDRILETGDWLRTEEQSERDRGLPRKAAAEVLDRRRADSVRPAAARRVRHPLLGRAVRRRRLRLRVPDRVASRRPVCGAVAVLVLFVHWPLLFDHGLRSNNMEAALFLSYCGGVYHFLGLGLIRTHGGAQRPCRSPSACSSCSVS